MKTRILTTLLAITALATVVLAGGAPVMPW